jgi:hypothetical protein
VFPTCIPVPVSDQQLRRVVKRSKLNKVWEAIIQGNGRSGRTDRA